MGLWSCLRANHPALDVSRACTGRAAPAGQCPPGVDHRDHGTAATVRRAVHYAHHQYCRFPKPKPSLPRMVCTGHIRGWAEDSGIILTSKARKLVITRGTVKPCQASPNAVQTNKLSNAFTWYASAISFFERTKLDAVWFRCIGGISGVCRYVKGSPFERKVRCAAHWWRYITNLSVIMFHNWYQYFQRPLYHCIGHRHIERCCFIHGSVQ